MRDVMGLHTTRHELSPPKTPDSQREGGGPRPREEAWRVDGWIPAPPPCLLPFPCQEGPSRGQRSSPQRILQRAQERGQKLSVGSSQPNPWTGAEDGNASPS